MTKSFGKFLTTALTLALLLSPFIHKETSAQPLNDTISQPFEELELSCLPAKGDSQLVINSEAEYKAVWKRMAATTECAGYHPPVIDFKKKTLLLFISTSGGCRRPNMVQREVFKVDTEKKYIVVLNLFRNGLCEKKWAIPFAAVVPKIEEGYKVEFANH